MLVYVFASACVRTRMSNHARQVPEGTLTRMFGTSVCLCKHILRRESKPLMLWHAQVDLSKRPFLVKSTDREYLAETVIISTGAVAKRMNFPGSDEETGFWCVRPQAHQQQRGMCEHKECQKMQESLAPHGSPVLEPRASSWLRAPLCDDCMGSLVCAGHRTIHDWTFQMLHWRPKPCLLCEWCAQECVHVCTHQLCAPMHMATCLGFA